MKYLSPFVKFRIVMVFIYISIFLFAYFKLRNSNRSDSQDIPIKYHRHHDTSKDMLANYLNNM